MSSDLRDVVRRDLDRIPLPPAAEWTVRRRRTSARSGLRLVLTAGAVVLIVIGSLVGGQVVRALRDRIESDRAASGSGLIPGSDLVYLADGELSAPYIQTIAMPKGESVGRIAGATYVGSPYEGNFTNMSGPYAYVPVGPPETPGAYLQMLDLNRGVPLTRIDIGTVALSRPLQTAVPGTPAFAAATATSVDGSILWLVVDGGDRGESATLSRFNVRGLSSSQLARTTTTLSQQVDSGGVRSRLIALGNERVALIREHYVGGNRLSSDWYVIDSQLKIVASYAGDDAHRLPNEGACSDIEPDPTGSGWILLCSDYSHSRGTALVFLDAASFAVTSTLPLDRDLGFALGMAVSPDDQIAVVTDRPLVIRVDAAKRTLTDARPVRQRQSWLDQLLPVPALAKSTGGRSVLFSPDARYAYVAAPADRWWGPLSTIDLSTAMVIATNTQIGFVMGLGLSTDGGRLYALASDAQGQRSLVLLAPNTLAIAGRSGVAGLPYAPFGIIAVSPASAATTPASPSPGSSPSAVAALPSCPPGQSPILEVSFPPPPGDAPGTGSGSAEAAFRRARPDVTTYTLLFPFGVGDSAPAWILFDGGTYVAELHGTPSGNNWFAYPARFAGCR